MSADLTCPTCAGKRTGDWFCPGCAGSGRRRPTLAEWDALKAERDWLRGDNRDLSAMVLNEREAYEDIEAERDRYRQALEDICSEQPCIGGPCCRCPSGVARAALDSDPDLTERTRRIRADE